MSRLRPYQARIESSVYAMWQQWAQEPPPLDAKDKKRNVLVVSPTGSGKTVNMGSMARNYTGATCASAHRSELVGQISTALAREGVRHRIIGSTALRKTCVSLHMEAIGHTLHDAGSRVAVCSVDTLVKQDMSHDSWRRNVGLLLQDEAHHVQAKNKWGRSFEMFPNTWGVGFTAESQRADGGGLGYGQGGLFHGIVMGPQPRELINEGYLTDYDVYTVKSNVDYSEVTVTASGELSMAKLRSAVHKSDEFVGDIVKQYQRIAPGKLGITFAVDVESAREIARAYRDKGIPAEVISADTDPLIRAQLFKRFTRREILQLVNVDLFGEGTDVPALEVVTMGRKTESFSLYKQQFGRVLRVMSLGPEIAALWDSFTPEQRRAHIAASPKPRGIVIDHVGNVIRHGLPDAPREQSLMKRDGGSSGPSGVALLRECLSPVCGKPFERFRICCPHCGWEPEPASRSSLKMVDGDLFKLDEETLLKLRGEWVLRDQPPAIRGDANLLYANGQLGHYHKRMAAQQKLRQLMDLWGGWKTHVGYSLREAAKMFYLVFGIDTESAKALGRAEAELLAARIHEDLGTNGVVAA